MPCKRIKKTIGIEQDFLDALDRLADGRPQHPDLREKLRRGKAVKINLATVSQEAGRARGLISKDNCRYPAVRQRILLETGKASFTRDDAIANLRAQVAELRVQLRQAEAHASYHFAQRTKAEGDAAYKYKYEQLNARRAAERVHRHAAAGVIPLFKDDGEDPVG